MPVRTTRIRVFPWPPELALLTSRHMATTTSTAGRTMAIEAPDSHGHSGVGKYIVVFVALCILTAMSFWTYADFPVAWPFHDEPAVGGCS